MEVMTCRDCGRLFNYIGGVRLCADCKAALEDKFVEVKEFLEEHRNATIQRVSEETGVSQKQLTQWVREERLAFSEDSSIFMQCDKCGENIRTGRFCDRCKADMTRGLNSMYLKEMEAYKKDKRESARMRFLDN